MFVRICSWKNVKRHSSNATIMDVDVASRKAFEEAARQVEAVEAKPTLKQQAKPEGKSGRGYYVNNKRRTADHTDEPQIVAAVTTGPGPKRARSTKDLLHITCYTCNRPGHYKSQCGSAGAGIGKLAGGGQAQEGRGCGARISQKASKRAGDGKKKSRR